MLGFSPAGIPIYVFRYIWGGPRFVGTMAQDLLWLRPDAVRQTSGGFYQVDYGRLDVRMVSLDEEVSLDGDDNVMQAIARALKSAKSDDRCFALTR